jgi:hypothetical protein
MHSIGVPIEEIVYNTFFCVLQIILRQCCNYVDGCDWRENELVLS